MCLKSMQVKLTNLIDLKFVSFFSVGELDKSYNIANGSEEEKTVAARGKEERHWKIES